jgi:hypothetical protein
MTATVIPFPASPASSKAAHSELLTALVDLRSSLTLLSVIAAQAEQRGEPLPNDARIGALLDGISSWLNASSPPSWRPSTDGQ